MLGGTGPGNPHGGACLALHKQAPILLSGDLEAFSGAAVEVVFS